MTIGNPKTFLRKNFKGLQLNAVSAQTQYPIQDPEDSLMVGLEFNLNMRKEDLKDVADLGYGNGGTVSKVLHVPTGTIMAKKVIYLETNSKVQKGIAQELETLQVCDSPFIVKYFGQFVEAKSVTICMEYMDCSSLDKIYKTVGPLSDEIIAAITTCVVDGLNYLKNFNITHRDVKPSNILVNSRGEIKLCDFGVSGVLINSIAETFVGTSTYMSPERISGGSYSSTGDVWSLGLTIVELARGQFPFAVDQNADTTPMGIFELLQRIVNEPPPTPPDHCCVEFKQFVSQCLQGEPEKRSCLQDICLSDFYQMGKQNIPWLAQWAKTLPRH